MKLYLISYTPGYSADFLASLVHKDKKFFPLESVERKTDNRFLFPNFPETFNSKMTNDINNFMLVDDYEYLKKTYKKNLCINTHMFADIQGPYESKIKVFASTERTQRISYAMWWHKSHTEIDLPDPERLEKIMNDSRVPEHLRTNYSKWKYLAWYKLKDENCSLANYITEIYKFNSGAGSTMSTHPGFTNIDLDRCMYANSVEVDDINNIFDINIDTKAIETYRDKNYSVLEDMKVNPDSKHFFQQLYEYAKKSLYKNEINLYNVSQSMNNIHKEEVNTIWN